MCQARGQAQHLGGFENLVLPPFQILTHHAACQSGDLMSKGQPHCCSAEPGASEGPTPHSLEHGAGVSMFGTPMMIPCLLAQIPVNPML